MWSDTGAVFETARDAAREYMGEVAHDKGNWRAAGEVVDRLGQLDLALHMIASRQSELMGRLNEWTAADTEEDHSLMERTAAQRTRSVNEIALLTEAFYYLAERIRTILKSAGLPHLKAPRRPWRVSTVRHNMLEHFAHQSTASYGGSWTFSGPDGPAFTKIGAEGTKDSGPLRKNALELATALEGRLRAATIAIRAARRGVAAPLT